MLKQKAFVVSKMDPLKYMMNKMVLNDRVVKWIIFLTKFDLEFISQKFIKS